MVTLHGLAPASGLAVIVQEAFRAGAVQIVEGATAGLTLPLSADHFEEVDRVISTRSLTPTCKRVSGVPSGAETRVFVTILHGAVGFDWPDGLKGTLGDSRGAGFSAGFGSLETQAAISAPDLSGLMSNRRIGFSVNWEDTGCAICLEA